jgi:cytochrome c-type biogenesis protein CcmH/NrfG
MLVMDKIAMLTEILKQNPSDAFARYGLAMAYASEGRQTEALAEFNTIVATTPDYVPSYQMSAQELLKAGRTDDARTRLEAGLAACDRTHNAHAASEMQAMLDDIS